MYERLVLFYTRDMDMVDVYIPFYYRGTKKQSAIQKAEYDFFNMVIECKKSNEDYSFEFLNNEFYLIDFLISNNINDYNGPQFITLDEYFEKTRMKMSEEEEKSLKREIKIVQLTDNQ